MASGLPCVASRIRGNEDLLQGSRLLFKSGDVDDLVKKIREVLKPDVQRKEIGHNDKNIRKFSIENTIQNMWKMYIENSINRKN